MGKWFHLGDILSITSGTLVSPRLIDGVYDILNYMTGENLFTHQLARAGDICRPHLLKQWPELEGVSCEDVAPENWKEKLEALTTKYGLELEIEPLPKGEYIPIDPITEAETMMGDPSKIIVVKVDQDGV